MFSLGCRSEFASGFSWRRVTLRSLVGAAVAVLVGSGLLGSSGAGEEPPASVRGAVSVAAAQAGGFSDVADGVFYSAPVEALAAAGVFAGTLCGDGFCPHEAIDRKTMAVWTVRVVTGEEPPAVSESRFSDVDAGSFYGPFVERMAELGITAGCSADPPRFCSDQSVTRAQMAVFLTTAFSLVDGPDPGFEDVPSTAWYHQAVTALADSGITAGCADDPPRFCPDQPTTRAQMATFLHRAISHEPPEPRIVFNRLEGFHLMVMDADGTNQRQLTPGVAWNPVWSPDGTRIAYHSENGQGIWVVNADGTDRRQITTDDGLSPVWSPDGARIAYAGAGIMVVNADGTDRRQVVPGSWAASPVWSPDGKRIAYHGGGDRRPNRFVGIRVVDIDGSNRRTLTEGGMYPDWSPDGTRITYQGLPYYETTPRSSLGISVVDTDGGNDRQLTNDKDTRPLWSPDGTRITYYRPYSYGPIRSIYVMKADGSDVQFLASGDDPAWSPDGDRIVYVEIATSGRSGQIRVMNADGSDVQFLARSGSDPVWSPDGDRIAYVGGGTVGFYSMDPDGANQRRHARFAAQDLEAEETPLKKVDTVAAQAVWSPKGTHVAYNDGRSLYVLDVDGANKLRAVVSGCGFIPSPLWSPDSNYISYKDSSSFVIAEVKTGRVQTVFDSGTLIWSPDSDRIAYTNSSYHGIFVSDIDGGNKRQLVTDRINLMAWSPDGTRIVYTSFVDYTTIGDMDMYVVNADGTNRQQIATGISAVFELTWSPDSTRIAYVSSFGNGLYALNADGTNPRSIVEASSSVNNIAWSPDSSRITYTDLDVYIYPEAGGSRAGTTVFVGNGIWVVNSDGTNPHLLTSGRDSRPVWITTRRP